METIQDEQKELANISDSSDKKLKEREIIANCEDWSTRYKELSQNNQKHLKDEKQTVLLVAIESGKTGTDNDWNLEKVGKYSFGGLIIILVLGFLWWGYKKITGK